MSSLPPEGSSTHESAVRQLWEGAGRIIDRLERLLPALVVAVLPLGYFLQESWTILFLQSLGVLLWAGDLLRHGRPAVAGSRFTSVLGGAVVALLLWQGVASLGSVDRSVSQPFFLKLIGLAGIAWVAARSLPHKETQTWLVGAVLLAGLAHGFLAVTEYLEGAPMPSTWVDPGTKGLIRTRTFSLFTDPNIFGSYLAALLPLLMAGFGEAGETEPRRQHLFAGMFVLVGISLLTTFSRGAFLAGVGGLGYVVLLTRRRWHMVPGRYLGVAVVIGLAVVAAVSPFRYRFTSMVKPGDLTFSQRSFINTGVMAALPQIPATGFGPHTFSQVYPRFRPVGGQYPFHAHNEFLQTLLETGIIGFLLLSVTAGLVAVHLLWLVWQPPEGLSWLVCGGIGSFVVFAIHNLSGFSDRVLATAGFLAVSVGAVAGTLPGTRAAAARVPLSGVGKAIVVLLLAGFLGFSWRNTVVQNLMGQGQAALSRGETQQAQALLEHVLRLDAGQPLAHFYLSQSHLGQGQLASAVSHLDSALELNSAEALFWAERANLAKRGGGDPLPFWNRAIALDPCSEHFRLALAQELLRQNSPAAARRELDAALSTSPGFHDIFTTYQQIEALDQQIKSNTR